MGAMLLRPAAWWWMKKDCGQWLNFGFGTVLWVPFSALALTQLVGWDVYGI